MLRQLLKVDPCDRQRLRGIRVPGGRGDKLTCGIQRRPQQVANCEPSLPKLGFQL